MSNAEVDKVDWLFPFQREDVDDLFGIKAALIGNEMGTGKTYEAIALDLERRAAEGAMLRESPKTLVISPLSVTGSWEEHYRKLAPHLRVVKIDPKKRGPFLKALKDQSADVYILHWDVLRIIREDLERVWFFHIIADEVHRAKNRKAQATRALKRLKATYRTGLSGTPILNQPQDLWSILNWLYPNQWRSFWKFYERYVEYEVVYPQGFRKVKGPRNEQELRNQMAPFFKRRRKMEVLKDLPDKYYNTIYVELDAKQRKAYDEMKKDMIAWLEGQDETSPLVAPVVIAQLTRLQQLAVAYAAIEYEEDGSSSVRLTDPSTKIDALMDILKDNPDEQIVVFSRFKQLVHLARRRVEAAGISCTEITGDVSQAGRDTAVADFQSGKARVFFGTIGAGGEGITLTAASTVVFLDRDWTPARNAQAEDRLHRIGQKNAVEVIDIVARDTVDRGHLQKLEMKKEWVRRLLD